MKKLLLVILFTLNILLLSTKSDASYAWTRMADFGGGVRDLAFGFSIGNYGYAGTGKNPADMDDFWQYDPLSNSWTQKANYPGQGRFGLIGFSIGNYGYAGTGWSGNGGGAAQYNDFWQYDPGNNSWIQKANFAGTPRYSAVGFAIGNKGYVGLGYTPLKNDFWEYDPTLDSWTQKTNFPSARQACIGFGIGNKGYVGMGYSSGNHYNDLFEFDPAANTWTAKSPLPAMTRRAPVAFVIGNDAFVGGGYNDTTYLTDFYKYDQISNQWTTVASIGGIPRYGSFGFAVNNYGYVGTGSFAGVVNPIRTSDFWRFEDCDGSQVGIQVNPNAHNDIYVFLTASRMNGIHLTYDLSGEKGAVFQFYNSIGQEIYSSPLQSNSGNMNFHLTLANEIYFYSIKNEKGVLHSGKVFAE